MDFKQKSRGLVVKLFLPRTWWDTPPKDFLLVKFIPGWDRTKRKSCCLVVINFFRYLYFRKAPHQKIFSQSFPEVLYKNKTFQHVSLINGF